MLFFFIVTAFIFNGPVHSGNLTTSTCRNIENDAIAWRSLAATPLRFQAKSQPVTQDDDLIKNRISLAPGQKKLLEQYDTSSNDKVLSKHDAGFSNTGNNQSKTALTTRTKDNAASSSARENAKNDASRKTNSSDVNAHTLPTATSSQVATPSYSTTASDITANAHAAPLTRGFTSIFTNPDRFISNGIEYLIVATLAFITIYKLFMKFRVPSRNE